MIDWEKIGAAAAALVVGLGALAHRVRRARSREAVESKHDEAETGMISRLEDQVTAAHAERNFAQDEARRERELRIAADIHAARLEGETADLKRFARRLLRAMPPEQRAIYETDFGRLDVGGKPK